MYQHSVGTRVPSRDPKSADCNNRRKCLIPKEWHKRHVRSFHSLRHVGAPLHSHPIAYQAEWIRHAQSLGSRCKRKNVALRIAAGRRHLTLAKGVQSQGFGCRVHHRVGTIEEESCFVVAVTPFWEGLLIGGVGGSWQKYGAAHPAN